MSDQQDDAARDLVQRAHRADPEPANLDTATGLADVVDRARRQQATTSAPHEELSGKIEQRGESTDLVAAPRRSGQLGVERDTANSAAREAVKTAVGVGSVFINYRSVDDPLGAALIHDRLAARFGQNKVFRDTASLTPSMHYPSAIQSAVRNAAVLIAVIGPRWLTLTDERAVRLIDREDDWVRRELAMAFANEVAVLPVLLKDTPTDAVMPTGAELPEDIRPLATLQAVEISQRRLSADLERLVTAITRIGHLPETPTVSQTPAIFFAIVETLEQIPSLRTDHDRAIVISQLPPAVANSVAYSARRRAHVINLLTACLDHPDGITSLLDVIRSVEEAWHHELLRLAELAAQLPSRT